jgi:hypothetical protein
MNYATFGNGHITDNFYNFIMIFVVQSVIHVGILLLSVLVIHSHSTDSWLMMQSEFYSHQGFFIIIIIILACVITYLII